MVARKYWFERWFRRDDGYFEKTDTTLAIWSNTDATLTE